MIMMCQCRVVICNKCTTWAGDVDSGRGCVCQVQVVGIWELFVLSAQFFWEPKIALKNKVYFKKRKFYMHLNIH